MKPDWITLSKSSGTGNETIQITAAPNTGGGETDWDYRSNN